ncbi:MAG: YidC/Oxa1 family membrane protein insertase [Clostridiales bacterium]|nr:YidC/Oxa1 family membrane protein insertase [Clostridiales bacterium]
MSFFDYLFFLFIEPLKLLFEVVFFYAYKFSNNVGLSIVVISLVINILVLPLYKRADKLEKEQREKKLSMKPWTDRIKAAFKGDERVMMLQAYYRENNYKTTSVFKESVSLFLQIPFFMAAYSFLSELKILQGVSLGPITDLASPDALIKIGALSINALPILMTAINIVASFIYSEKGNIKDKVKLVLIALVFLVLLYNSPAGLVFYWTLNNVFSLGKNIVTHFKKPEPKEKTKKESFAFDKKSFAVIMLSCATLAVLTGFMIPSDVISENPTELIRPFGVNPCNPVLYLLSSGLTAVGTFMIWTPLFIVLTKNRFHKYLEGIMPALAVAGICNYVLFNKNFGNLSKKLIYEHSMKFNITDILLNLFVDIAVIVLVTLLFMKLKKYKKLLIGVAMAGVISISVINVSLSLSMTVGHNYTYGNTEEDIVIPMTSTGKNVVVIMMDRMIGGYIPYIMNERPELAEQFDGFTYYPNTVSHGHSTNNAAPALFGGYEYTPANLNKRSDELLVDKHNEALKVLPTIFSDKGWKVSVGDPPYANYEWLSDVSIYDDNDKINAYNMFGVMTNPVLTELGEEYEIRLNRNLFCYGFMKTLPYLFQPVIYSQGTYDDMNLLTGKSGNISAISDPLHTQVGLDETHLGSRLVLESLDDIVEINNEDNCFFMFANNTTHDITLLEEPSYSPAYVVDNTEYDLANEDRFVLDGRTVHMDDYLSYAHYQTSMSACILLGEWFDYLRENGLYDNTRIIIVADHGYSFKQFDDMVLPDLGYDAEQLNPVLLVKDFGSAGFTVSDEFMTNADVPSLALEGIVDSPVNPFTGNPINMDSKNGDQIIYISGSGSVLTNNGTQFVEADRRWFTVHDNIFDKNNWGMLQGDPD